MLEQGWVLDRGGGVVDSPPAVPLSRSIVVRRTQHCCRMKSWEHTGLSGIFKKKRALQTFAEILPNCHVHSDSRWFVAVDTDYGDCCTGALLNHKHLQLCHMSTLCDAKHQLHEIRIACGEKNVKFAENPKDAAI